VTSPSQEKRPLKIALVTAGGAGMFCGSCMHDNTLARALMNLGADVSLIPTYTPIRVDEENVSSRKVFLGGINVYLESRWRLWRKIPHALKRWMDSPRVIDFFTKFSVSNDAKTLGQLTLDVLEGESGVEKNAVEELVEFIAEKLQPDIVCFSNSMLVGIVRRLQQRFSGPVFCFLQGEDIFLEDLSESYRRQALEIIRRRAQDCDGFLVHSAYYKKFMSEYLQIPSEKIHQIPLGIDFAGHDGNPTEGNGQATVGYFARICPEKGLHQLVEAFRLVKKKIPHAKLRAGGELVKRDHRYFRKLQDENRDLGDAFEYIGSPKTHREKVEFLKSLDLLSVPTVYREPKGIYVLEALANGTPVVQPNHGAFPELLSRTAGGVLVEAENTQQLASALCELIGNHPQRFALATTGHAQVREHYSAEKMAEVVLKIFGNAISSSSRVEV